MRQGRRLDDQLEFGISDYALAGRAEWLDRLLHDPVVTRTIADLAAETGEPESALRQRASRDAREIVPFFNAVFYFRIGYWLARWYLRMLYWIRAEFTDRVALGDIGRDSCVVLVSNHRSNLDPFILIYLASRRAAISYSAGEWARPWPFSYLLHAIGFYIVRRDGSGDRLYRTLVQRYVYLAASRCVPQGLFLEGGLSRDGKMQPLKLGLLSYLLKARGQEQCRDIVFVPVGLAYDRIPEDKTLLAAVLLEARSVSIGEMQLKQRAMALAETLRGAGALVMLSPGREEREFAEAIYLLLKRRVIELRADGCLSVTDRGRPLLVYYCNSIPGSMVPGEIK